MKVIFMQKEERKKRRRKNNATLHYIEVNLFEDFWSMFSASLNNPRDLNKLKGYFIYYSESNKEAGFNNINS